jgi:hypothetical protein
MTKIYQAIPMMRMKDSTVCMTSMFVWTEKRQMQRKRKKISIE